MTTSRSATGKTSRIDPLATAVAGGPGEAVRRDFEEFGLNGHEAKVLLALVRVGSATAVDLARLSGVHRTSVYPVLQDLAARGLADQIPGKMAVWVSPGRDEVVERLYWSQEERLHVLKARMEQTRRSLERLGTDDMAGPIPHLHILNGAAQAKRAYDKIIGDARSEVVIFNLPPYSWRVGESNPTVTEALDRGVRIRALYQQADVEAPDAMDFRRGIEGFHAAGVDGRVVDEVPAKLVVVDRSVAMLAIPPPQVGDGYPSVLHIEHAGVAAMHADAFEHRWAVSRPYRGVHEDAAADGARHDRTDSHDSGAAE